MEDIKKSRQFILCTTVIRYSYVRKIDANQAGWGFNFQSQTKEEYQRWLQIPKTQIPNCEKFARLEILSLILFPNFLASGLHKSLWSNATSFEKL